MDTLFNLLTSIYLISAATLLGALVIEVCVMEPFARRLSRATIQSRPHE